MTRVEKLKNSIKNDLLSFKKTVTVPHYNAQGLFQTVLNEHPEVAIFVSGWTFVGSLLGGSFNVDYANTEYCPADVARIDTKEGLENVLHKSIQSFVNTKILAVKDGIDVASTYSEFFVAYDGFYSNLLEMGYQTSQMEGVKWQVVIFTFKYRIGRVKLNMMERQVNEKIQELDKKLFLKDMRAETKAYIAHNYLAQTVVYWTKDEPNPLEKSYMQSAYGALINGKCVCQGYAEAYKRLLNSQNIICEVICGKVKGSKVYHAWNVVSFDGVEYYHVDVTWDAKNAGVKRDKYFCLSDADMVKDRLWTRLSYVSCNGKEDILKIAKQQIESQKLRYTAKGIGEVYLK